MERTVSSTPAAAGVGDCGLFAAVRDVALRSDGGSIVLIGKRTHERTEQPAMHARQDDRVTRLATPS